LNRFCQVAIVVIGVNLTEIYFRTQPVIGIGYFADQQASIVDIFFRCRVVGIVILKSTVHIGTAFYESNFMYGQQAILEQIKGEACICIVGIREFELRRGETGQPVIVVIGKVEGIDCIEGSGAGVLDIHFQLVGIAGGIRATVLFTGSKRTDCNRNDKQGF
jgi:hypothetical protein